MRFIKTPIIPILAFLAILFLRFKFAFSVGINNQPGWHATIYPPYYFALIILSTFIMFALIGCWLALNNPGKINWILFLLHCLLSIPALLIIIFPSILLNAGNNNFQEEIYFRLQLITPAKWIFDVSQILFPVYFFRTFYSKKMV